MIRLLQVNDVHIQDQRYGSRVDDPVETIFGKLEHVYRFAEKQQADVIITGDLFNKKSSWRVSHALVQRLARFFDGWREHGVVTYLIAGTHDLANGRIESIPRQPIGTLLMASTVVYIAPGLNVFDQRGEEFLVWGAPGVYTLDQDHEAYIFPPSEGFDNPNRVTVSHGMLLRPNETFFGDYTSMPYVAASTSAVLHLNGHPHWYMGQTVLKAPSSPTGTCLFSNPGSLYRVSAAKENQTRDILVGYFEIEGGNLVTHRELRVPSLPFDEVFQRQEQELPEHEQEADFSSFAGYVESARNDLAFELTTDGLVQAVAQSVSNMDDSEAVVEAARRYLELAEERM